jgi:hypothetical protein
MGLYKQKLNLRTGQYNLVPTGTIITFKDGVANTSALPVSGNTLNDARITADTGHLYVWNGTTWVDSGDIIDLKWSAIDGKPSSSVTNIDDAVSKRHSNSLDHTQGTDQGLDTGGSNAVTAAQAKTGYSHSQVAHAPSNAVSLATVKADTDIDNAIDNTHAPHSDDQVIPTQLSDLSDDTTHRLVTDTEKSLWNEITDVSLNVMLNAFRIAQIGSLTIFNMIKGFMDEYEDESGIDLVNSVNQNYEPTDDYYTNQGFVDSYTKLLLHLDNNVTDSELTPKTVTNNSVTFSGSIKKFGTHSGIFDGGSTYLRVPNTDGDFNFGAGDFTIDFWIKPNNLSAEQFLFSSDDGSYFRHWFTINTNDSLTWTSEQCTSFSTSTSLGLLDGNWHHIALVRNGNDFVIYVDGISKGTTSTSNPIGSTGYFYIGLKSYNGDHWYNGYMDEFRVSKGIARWTTAFTPPTSDYPISGDMTLFSNVQVASITPTSSRIVLFEEDLDIITLNTDLKAYISRDNGTTYSQVTLKDEGNYITGARVLSGIVNISAQPSGSNIKYKVETLNNKKLNIHGVGISWK